VDLNTAKDILSVVAGAIAVGGAILATFNRLLTRVIEKQTKLLFADLDGRFSSVDERLSGVDQRLTDIEYQVAPNGGGSFRDGYVRLSTQFQDHVRHHPSS
jgi:hypothetical protein